MLHWRFRSESIHKPLNGECHMLRSIFQYCFGLCIVSSAALVLGGCGGDSTSNSVSVDGTWNGKGMVIGSSLSVVLSSQNTTLSGTGSYHMEAGQSGTLTVAGSYQYPQVSLSLNYDNGTTATFSGALSSSTEMDGTLTYASGSTTSISFVRQ
jgi:hypothetical protein